MRLLNMTRIWSVGVKWSLFRHSGRAYCVAAMLLLMSSLRCIAVMQCSTNGAWRQELEACVYQGAMLSAETLNLTKEVLTSDSSDMLKIHVRTTGSPVSVSLWVASAQSPSAQSQPERLRFRWLYTTNNNGTTSGTLITPTVVRNSKVITEVVYGGLSVQNLSEVLKSSSLNLALQPLLAPTLQPFLQPSDTFPRGLRYVVLVHAHSPDRRLAPQEAQRLGELAAHCCTNRSNMTGPWCDRLAAASSAAPSVPANSSLPDFCSWSETICARNGALLKLSLVNSLHCAPNATANVTANATVNPTANATTNTTASVISNATANATAEPTTSTTVNIDTTFNITTPGNSSAAADDNSKAVVAALAGIPTLAWLDLSYSAFGYPLERLAPLLSRSGLQWLVAAGTGLSGSMGGLVDWVDDTSRNNGNGTGNGSSTTSNGGGGTGSTSSGGGGGGVVVASTTSSVVVGSADTNSSTNSGGGGGSDGGCGALAPAGRLLLDLSDNALQGPVPECLAAHVSLRELRLAGNKGLTALPSNWSAATDLTDLDISSCPKLAGPLTALPPNLTALLASHTALASSLPALPPSLIALEASDAGMYGTLPDSLATDVPKLLILDLGNNLLTGSVPAALPSSLMALHLSGNHLNGSLPGHLPLTLRRLMVARNQLSGTLPNLTSLTTLESVDVSENQFSAVQTVRYSLRCLVKWKGFTHEHDGWIPNESFINDMAQKEYWASRPRNNEDVAS